VLFEEKQPEKPEKEAPDPKVLIIPHGERFFCKRLK
tara:strand:- start:419 stop:526 length:108 start_codon:yes stop_codon:yes gene_type:complete